MGHDYDDIQSAAGHILSSKSGKQILTLAEMERTYINYVIALCDGNIIQAAQYLEISPSTLYRKRTKWLA